MQRETTENSENSVKKLLFEYFSCKYSKATSAICYRSVHQSSLNIALKTKISLCKQTLCTLVATILCCRYLRRTAKSDNCDETSMSTCSPASSGGCRGSSKLSDEMIHEELGKLSEGVWILSEDKLKISIEVMTRNWKGAIDFINELSLLAESSEISHHPGTLHWCCKLLDSSQQRYIDHILHRTDELITPDSRVWLWQYFVTVGTVYFAVQNLPQHFLLISFCRHSSNWVPQCQSSNLDSCCRWSNVVRFQTCESDRKYEDWSVPEVADQSSRICEI